MNDQQILAQLQQSSYEKLFVLGEAAQILARPGVETELTAIMTANELEPKLRVLAHELLIETGQPVRLDLAESYCQALPASFQHNWWGMPGQYLERLGQTMIIFGQAAVPCLTRLLDNRQPLGYFGSEEPTLSNAMKYRVCDLAAYLIATIEQIPYQDIKQAAKRDRFIAELLQKISE